MTVFQLKNELKKFPDDASIFFDDLQGGRIPVNGLRVEPAAKFLKPKMYGNPSLVVIYNTPSLEQD